MAIFLKLLLVECLFWHNLVIIRRRTSASFLDDVLGSIFVGINGRYVYAVLSIVFDKKKCWNTRIILLRYNSFLLFKLEVEKFENTQILVNQTEIRHDRNKTNLESVLQ